MRIALCQVNPTVGALEANARRIVDFAHRAKALGADLAVYPELALVGYPPRDLLERADFLAAADSHLDAIAAAVPAGLQLLFGAPVQRDATNRRASPGPGLHNAVIQVARGERRTAAIKSLLPSYDVFDEERYFAAGGSVARISQGGQRIGLTVCEDLWNAAQGAEGVRLYAADPLAALAAETCDIVVNLSASPFHLSKRRARAERLADAARKARCPLVYVNQVGGNDDLLFDGASQVFDAQGQPILQLPEFVEAIDTLDWHSDFSSLPAPGETLSDMDALAAALRMGINDYARKCGFQGVVLGLSGGIDSALVATLAAQALGPEAVHAIAMPSRYSSAASLLDARRLAQSLGIALSVVPIEPMFAAYAQTLSESLHMPEIEDASAGAVWENIQARTRCAIVMAYANSKGHLALTTGNKSEIAVGYCTLYGDMGGGLAVISDLLKTRVYELARHLNRSAGRELIPQAIIEKAPSAELRPNQKDSDSLPSYDVLDAILAGYIEGMRSETDLVASGLPAPDVARVVQLVRQSEHKRRQMPPGLIVTPKAFGPGRRMPVAAGHWSRYNDPDAGSA